MYDAIVVAGGSSRRLDGADKPAVEIGGRTLLDLVLAAVADASRRIVVGPRRPAPPEVVWTREQPPGGGPVAAIAAGLDHVTAPMTVVLAADLPAIGPAVPALLAALAAGDLDVAVLQGNPLAAAWSTAALRAALAGLDQVENAAARWLLGGVRVESIPDELGWGEDCDTWDDVARARARLGS